MKLSTNALLAAAAGLAISGSALAQQAAVQATKTSPLTEAAGNLYGKFDMRHVTDRYMTNDTVTNDKLFLELRPTIGTELFNKSVDVSFNWIFTKNGGNDTLEKSYFYNVTQWKVLDNGKDSYFGPYAETYFNNSQFTDSLVGVYGEGVHEVPVTTGAVVFKGFIQPNVRWTSANVKNAKDVENQTGRPSMSLTDAASPSEPDKTEQDDPSYYNIFGGSVAYKPAAVKGFSIGVGSEIDQVWDPKYKGVVNANGDDVSELNGYEANHVSISKFNLSYAINDSVTVINQVRHYMGGVYEKNVDAKSARYENRLVLSATLF